MRRSSFLLAAITLVGFALMWEVVYIAASLRLPMVMALVNRALSAPLNIHCDHSDSMSCRDTGWLQVYAENAQEAYELTFFAVRVAEHPDVRLPVMVCQDGFLVSHTLEPVEVLPDAAVEAFVGTYQAPRSLLDLEHPVTVGPLDLPSTGPGNDIMLGDEGLIRFDVPGNGDNSTWPRLGRSGLFPACDLKELSASFLGFLGCIIKRAVRHKVSGKNPKNTESTRIGVSHGLENES